MPGVAWDLSVEVLSDILFDESVPGIVSTSLVQGFTEADICIWNEPGVAWGVFGALSCSIPKI
jgi:hypothetical protein